MKNKHKLAYMRCAEAFAECSNATRLKVGAVLVKNNRIISCGYNAMPEHIDEPCETADGLTDSRVRHAEMNALKGLMKSSESAVGASLFVTHAPCIQCAIDIVDSGIKQVFYKEPYRNTDGLQYLTGNYIQTEIIDNGL